MTLLRVILLLEVLIMAAAIGTGIQLESWREVPVAEIRSSPDALYYIQGLLRQYSFFSGAYSGMAIALSLVAFTQRGKIVQGSIFLKAHWFVVLLLPIVVLTVAVWFGSQPW
ncbi:MAG: hypothetical protein WA191_25190 [Telluria sp.]